MPRGRNSPSLVKTMYNLSLARSIWGIVNNANTSRAVVARLALFQLFGGWIVKMRSQQMNGSFTTQFMTNVPRLPRLRRLCRFLQPQRPQLQLRPPTDRTANQAQSNPTDRTLHQQIPRRLTNHIARNQLGTRREKVVISSGSLFLRLSSLV